MAGLALEAGGNLVRFAGHTRAGVLAHFTTISLWWPLPPWAIRTHDPSTFGSG